MIEYVQFFPTLRCNQKCSFCFSRTLSGDDFPEEKIEQLIGILRENKISNLDILGGEPFFYPHLDSLVSQATKNGIRVTISTNGSMTETLDNFLSRAYENVKVGVSINKKPDYKLLELIKTYRIWIKTVITREQFPESQILEFAKNHEINYYLIYMDALTEKDLNLSMPFYEFIERVEKMQKSYPNIEPVYCKGFIGGNLKYRCPAMTEKITLLPDGSVYPCYLLANKREFCIGNIFRDNLSEMLSSDMQGIFKNFNGNKCINKTCRFHKDCRGGCIAHCIIHEKTTDGFDPRCKLNH